MTEKLVRIGGATAFFEDSFYGHPAMMRAGADYLVYDYLAEVTMSILASDTGNPGFHLNFLEDIRPYLRELLDSGIKLVTNWGGLDPEAAAQALRELGSELGKSPTIAVVRGDDLRERVDELRTMGVREMFSGAPLPEDRTIDSANAYLGGFPIAAALDAGADIVITGRVVDSALSLGPLIHEFGWTPDDHDKLAAGTLIGHLLECSTQATGGLSTDWMEVPSPEDIGNPICECHADGSFVLTKPEGTGGLVTIGSVAEQMIYEVSDPQAYFAPDVVADFSEATFEQVDNNRVLVSGVRGYPPSASYKVCATYNDGWRGQVYQPIIGIDAAHKARRQAQALFDRTNNILRLRNAKPLNLTHVEVLGAECSYGPRSRQDDTREVVAMMTVDHDEQSGVKIFLKEQICAISAMAQGTAMNLGGLMGRGVMPLMQVFNFLLPKSEVTPVVTIEGRDGGYLVASRGGFEPTMLARPADPSVPDDIEPDLTVPLVRLAWARSGDKGNLFNVGAFARDPGFYPYIAAALSADAVAGWFAHLVDDSAQARADRYLLPGSHGLNFVVHESLGGGASVCARVDPLAKAMGQILLDFPIPVSRAIFEEFSQEEAFAAA
ncbi:MAG: DUF1446 domain-containing protein [Novosphingobium sp.]|nr:DUF1446 domain-containing protein [Novosphingobium sp.]